MAPCLASTFGEPVRLSVASALEMRSNIEAWQRNRARVALDSTVFHPGNPYTLVRCEHVREALACAGLAMSMRLNFDRRMSNVAARIDLIDASGGDRSVRTPPRVDGV